MKLVIIASGNFFSDYGGGQVYVRNIVDEMALHTQITTIVISFDESQKPSVKEYKGIAVYQIIDYVSLKETLFEIKPDIVHANGKKLATSRVCKLLGIPCVVTAHHGGIVCPAGTLLNTEDKICDIPADYSHCLKCYLRNTPTGLCWYPVLKKIDKKKYVGIGEWLSRHQFVPFITSIGKTSLIVNEKLKDWHELSETATHFIAPSDAIAESLQRNGCSPQKITVIPHGIPIIREEVSTDSIFQHSTIRFYYAGRINYVKGIHVLLQAFISVQSPNIELHLIGDSANKSEKKYSERLKKKYSNDKRIVWHGKLPYSQMIENIKAFHCLIHPAIYLEVFGLDICEALALHKYVIATRCGGADMQIHSKEEGILVKPNDARSLANAIEEYIKTPKQTDCKVQSITEHVADLISLYKKLIN